MLCPEVWNFSLPASSSFCHQYETQENLTEFIKQQYFNHYVSITMPGTLSAPDDLNNLFKDDTDFYKIEKIPAVEFFQSDFINLFIRKGQLTALSVKALSDRKDALACTPDGILILSLSNETYQELGLSIKSSSTSHCFAFDVNSECENLESSLKEIKAKLKQCENILNFDIILAWEPDDTKICTSTIAFYFTKKNYLVKTCSVLSESKCEYNKVVPTDVTSSSCGDFIEWLGAFALQCKMDLDCYLSSFKCPEKSENLGQVLNLSSTGLVSTSRINKIASKIRNYINTESRSCWIAVFVQAFRNSIVHKKNNQLVLSDGDQHYCLIFKKNCPTLVHFYTGSIK